MHPSLIGLIIREAVGVSVAGSTPVSVVAAQAGLNPVVGDIFYKWRSSSVG